MSIETSPWKLGTSAKAIVPCAISILVALISLSRRHHHPQAAFAFIGAFALLAFWHSTRFTPDEWINNIFARYQLIFFLHHSFLHLVATQEELEEERRQWRSSPMTPGDRSWTFGYKMLFNALCLNTRWEVRRPSSPKTAPAHVEAKTAKRHTVDPAKTEVRHKSAVQKTPSKDSQSRSRFVLRQSFVLLVRYIILCIYYDPAIFFWLPSRTQPSVFEYDSAHRSLLNRLVSCFAVSDCSVEGNDTARNLLVAILLRLHWVLESIIKDWAILSSYHDILAIVAVSTGLDKPHEWPEFYGNIMGAYTVRHFWAHFWHLLVYRSFSAHAATLLRVLRVPKRNAAARLIHNGLVFMASGVMHWMVDVIMANGDCGPCGCQAKFWWYSMQILGIAAESVFISLMHGAMPRALVPGFVERALGYGWVICWLMFTSERATFPELDCKVKRASHI